MSYLALLRNLLGCAVLCSFLPASSPASTLLYATVTNPTASATPPGVVRIDENGAYSMWNIDWDDDSIVLQNPQGIDVDGGGNVYVHDGASIYKITPTGNGTLFATKPESGHAFGLTVDGAGNVYATGMFEAAGVIYRYNSAGVQTAMWSGSATALEISPSGSLYSVDSNAYNIWKYDSEGARIGAAAVTGAWDIDVNAAGYVFVTALNRRVTAVTPDGNTNLSWYFSSSLTGSAIALDAEENVYVGNRASGDSRIRKINSNALVSGDPFTDLEPDLRINFLAVAVPEPGAVCLMVVGFVALGGLRRRR